MPHRGGDDPTAVHSARWSRLRPRGLTSVADPAISVHAARCGREIPVLSVPADQLRFYGWRTWQLWSAVEWSGHQIEGIPVPDADGRWQLIVIEGEAT